MNARKGAVSLTRERLTPRQVVRKKEELEGLYDRYKVAGKKLGEAASHTGSVLAKTPEYTSITGELRVLEERIAQLEEELENVIIIDPSKFPRDAVSVVSLVKVRDLQYGVDEKYCFEGVVSDDGWVRISRDSPFGRALVGKKVGDVVEIKTPSNLKRVEILEVVTGEEE